MIIKRNAALKRRALLEDRSIGSRIMDVLVYVVFGLYAFICIYPFYYIIINSLSDNKLSERGVVMFYPMQMHLQNYMDAFKIPGLANAAKNSVLRTVIGTVLVLFTSSFMGYMFTRDTMWKRRLWYRIVIVTMYFNAGIVPWYLTMMNLGMTNNFLGYILPMAVSPFYIILIKTYIESTPIALQEAAVCDGAGVLTIFFRIIVPVCMPIMATIAIFAAVAQWNSFQDTLLLMTQEKYYTLQFVLYRYLQSSASLKSIINASASSTMVLSSNAQTQTSVRMTVTVLVALPILMVYPFFQRFLVKGIMIGAVKG
ncbi:MAG: carbohydrate ABC transporter permease [Oscillospiraceae bacterium]|jgi:ABC-type glycerol-3-phosphate transport system permease component|nr:carbohydrate ABC transporter permease [Oscillospiraceae bacterium]